jgi:hypothetical protein
LKRHSRVTVSSRYLRDKLVPDDQLLSKQRSAQSSLMCLGEASMGNNEYPNCNLDRPVASDLTGGNRYSPPTEPGDDDGLSWMMHISLPPKPPFNGGAVLSIMHPFQQYVEVNELVSFDRMTTRQDDSQQAQSQSAITQKEGTTC